MTCEKEINFFVNLGVFDCDWKWCGFDTYFSSLISDEVFAGKNKIDKLKN